MYLIAEAMTRWMAPILSFTAQEIWQALPTPSGETREEFVFTGEWFDGLPKAQTTSALNNDYWNEILLVRTEVNKALENARKEKQVGKALEAAVTLYTTAERGKNLQQLGEELRFVLITSKATIEVVESAPEGALTTEIEGLWLSVAPATGSKCDRCWHVTEDIGQHDEHKDLCGRCITNIDDKGEVRQFA
jgi:isoleucyl-tRNA synthetase